MLSNDNPSLPENVEQKSLRELASKKGSGHKSAAFSPPDAGVPGLEDVLEMEDQQSYGAHTNSNKFC